MMTRLATYRCMCCDMAERPYGLTEIPDFLPRINCSLCKGAHLHQFVGNNEYEISVELEDDGDKINNISFQRARRIEVSTMMDERPRFIDVLPESFAKE